MTSAVPSVPVPVRALDERSRALSEVLPDERTPRDEEPATIPDVTPGGPRPIHLASAPVDKAGLIRVPAFVDLGIGPEAITRPDASEPEEVFAPMRGSGRVVDLEAPTPRHRPPFRSHDHDADTDLDGPERFAARTVTYRGDFPAQDRAEPKREAAAHEREKNGPKRDWENERERRLVDSVIDTERSFNRLRETNPARASHIKALQHALAKGGVFSERELALAVHAREKIGLVDAAVNERERREDRVYALGLLARDIDDRYRDHTQALKAHLLADVRELPPAKRDEIFADFDTFKESGAAADSNFCRRELHRALRNEPVLHRAYVYALALDKRSDPQRVEADAATLLAGLGERSTA